jgi:hypothetical protein
MKVIMLSGDTDKGKSITLNMVYDSINPKTIVEPKKVLGNPIYKDFECIIEYEGKSIAFYTMGDYSNRLIDAFKKYDTKCEYLICACNTGFQSPYKVIKNYQYTIIEKTVAKSKAQADLDFANETDCKKIMDVIKNDRFMKVIMLLGDTNKGKTTTLNMLYDSEYLAEKNIIEPKKQIRPRPDDFECIIEYKKKHIAFYTMGDILKWLTDAYARYNTKCNYLICACNTRFKNTNKKIRYYPHIIIDKTVAESPDLNIANNADIEKIISEII